MRTKKILSVLSVFLLSTSLLVGCNNQESVTKNDQEAKVYEIYELAKADGFTGTYEEWLDSIKGERGEKGPKGDTGEPGPKGDKGDPGEPGAKGDPGEKGPKGDTGATGPKGDTGAAGPKGETGETGAKGDKGDPGLTGPKGDKGDKGDTGAQGPKGDKGDPGAAGTAGTTPHIGENGNWFIGTVDTGVKAEYTPEEKRTCVVKFYDHNYKLVPQLTEEVLEGECLPRFALDEWEVPGKKFIGWFTENGDKVDALTPINEDLELAPRYETHYAKFPVMYTIKEFDASLPVYHVFNEPEFTSQKERYAIFKPLDPKATEITALTTIGEASEIIKASDYQMNLVSEAEYRQNCVQGLQISLSKIYDYSHFSYLFSNDSIQYYLDFCLEPDGSSAYEIGQEFTQLIEDIQNEFPTDFDLTLERARQFFKGGKGIEEFFYFPTLNMHGNVEFIKMNHKDEDSKRNVFNFCSDAIQKLSNLDEAHKFYDSLTGYDPIDFNFVTTYVDGYDIPSCFTFTNEEQVNEINGQYHDFYNMAKLFGIDDEFIEPEEAQPILDTIVLEPNQSALEYFKMYYDAKMALQLIAIDNFSKMNFTDTIYESFTNTNMGFSKANMDAYLNSEQNIYNKYKYVENAYLAFEASFAVLFGSYGFDYQQDIDRYLTVFNNTTGCNYNNGGPNWFFNQTKNVTNRHDAKLFRDKIVESVEQIKLINQSTLRNELITKATNVTNDFKELNQDLHMDEYIIQEVNNLLNNVNYYNLYEGSLARESAKREVYFYYEFNRLVQKAEELLLGTPSKVTFFDSEYKFFDVYLDLTNNRLDDVDSSEYTNIFNEYLTDLENKFNAYTV